MGQKLSLLLAVVTFAALACNSESSDGGGSAGSGTAGSGTAGSGTAGSGTAGSGTAGSAGSGTAGSGTAGSSAAMGYACYLDMAKQCTQVNNAPAAAVEQAKMTCMTNGGISSDKCPAMDLLGCCVNGGASCYYPGIGHDAAKLADACMKGGGMWQTTIP